MRFMILVKANGAHDADESTFADPAWPAELAAYHDALARAGALLDGAGLRPTRDGFRIRYEGDRRTFVDGPFDAAAELLAGYTLIEVRSVAEAREWARRFPDPSLGRGSAEIEIRRLDDPDDIAFDGPDAPIRRRAFVRATPLKAGR